MTKVWKPIEDGRQEIVLGRRWMNIKENGRTIEVETPLSESVTDMFRFDLYSEIRICELVEVDAPAAVTIPSEVRQAISLALSTACYDAKRAGVQDAVDMFDAAKAWLDSLPTPDA